MSLRRRDFLARLGFGAVFLPALAGAPRSLVGDLLFDPEDAAEVPPKAVPPNPFVREGKALVAVVHGRDPGTMLQAGLDLLGGLDPLPVTGKRVLVKPNVVNDRPPPTTTSPAVVSAVVRRLRAAGAGDVIVADSSGMIRFPTSGNLSQTGIRAAAESAGARVLALDDEPWVKIHSPRAAILPTVYLSKPVYDADVFVNLPVVKTHKFAHYSCCLKNLVGITHPRYRPSLAFLAGNWHERIAELNLGLHPQLNVADATTIMIEGGPTSGTPAEANLLLLSGDRVALDAVAVALIRSHGVWPKVMEGRVWDQRQIRRAIELGLGVAGPEAMALVTTSVSGHDPAFEKLVETVRKDVFRSEE